MWQISVSAEYFVKNSVLYLNVTYCISFEMCGVAFL